MEFSHSTLKFGRHKFKLGLLEEVTTLATRTGRGDKQGCGKLCVN